MAGRARSPTARRCPSRSGRNGRASERCGVTSSWRTSCCSARGAMTILGTTIPSTMRWRVPIGCFGALRRRAPSWPRKGACRILYFVVNGMLKPDDQKMRSIGCITIKRKSSSSLVKTKYHIQTSLPVNVGPAWRNIFCRPHPPAIDLCRRLRVLRLTGFSFSAASWNGTTHMVDSPCLEELEFEFVADARSLT